MPAVSKQTRIVLSDAQNGLRDILEAIRAMDKVPSNAAIAMQLEVHDTRLYRFLSRHPEIAEEIRKAKEEKIASMPWTDFSKCIGQEIFQSNEDVRMPALKRLYSHVREVILSLDSIPTDLTVANAAGITERVMFLLKSEFPGIAWAQRYRIVTMELETLLSQLQISPGEDVRNAIDRRLAHLAIRAILRLKKSSGVPASEQNLPSEARIAEGMDISRTAFGYFIERLRERQPKIYAKVNAAMTMWADSFPPKEFFKLIGCMRGPWEWVRSVMDKRAEKLLVEYVRDFPNIPNDWSVSQKFEIGINFIIAFRKRNAAYREAVLKRKTELLAGHMLAGESDSEIAKKIGDSYPNVVRARGEVGRAIAEGKWAIGNEQWAAQMAGTVGALFPFSYPTIYDSSPQKFLVQACESGANGNGRASHVHAIPEMDADKAIFIAVFYPFFEAKTLISAINSLVCGGGVIFAVPSGLEVRGAALDALQQAGFHQEMKTAPAGSDGGDSHLGADAHGQKVLILLKKEKGAQLTEMPLLFCSKRLEHAEDSGERAMAVGWARRQAQVGHSAIPKPAAAPPRPNPIPAKK